MAAFASLGAYETEGIAEDVIESLATLPEEVRPASFALLLSRTAWSERLVAALESGTLKAEMVPRDTVDQMRSHGVETVRSAASKMPAAGAGYDFSAKIGEVEKVLKSGTGSPYDGEAIFMQRCASCHKLFFKGGKIGPELTSYQRDDLGTMLISIVNPNAEVREGFQFISVVTKDGRTLTGFEVERDLQVTVLRGLDGQEITEVTPMGRSLMPEGLLEGLDQQQLRDFFAYLRISQPISR